MINDILSIDLSLLNPNYLTEDNRPFRSSDFKKKFQDQDI